MCGIAGIIQLGKKKIDTPSSLHAMTDAIKHRGPDGAGHYYSADGKIALGHRRLSIIDLSNEANQPMHYLERYTIVFNGEIYNYIELTQLLKKYNYTFNTSSDTEVLLAMYDHFGVDCLQYFDGMFAFVIYDRIKDIIFCARDRFGEKPFFYSYKSNEHFYFASEMKSLFAGGISNEINTTMMFNYLYQQTIENQNDLSETFYTNCSRLEHSHYIMIDLKTNNFKIEKYYSLDWKAVNHDMTENEATSKLSELFYSSITRRMRSDVPIGSSLSGGLDSSLVVCAINELNNNNGIDQSTFSAIFPGFSKDESKYINIVLDKCKAKSFFTTPSDDELVNDLEKLFWHQEEPFHSSSIYVQYKVMQLARTNGVKVLLDGQGADEILAGYHHFYKPYFNELSKTKPELYKIQKEKYLNLHADNAINGVLKQQPASLIRTFAPQIFAPVRKIKNVVNQIVHQELNKDFFYSNYLNSFDSKETSYKNLNEQLQYATMTNGLQQLLRYADRNSMAHSLEVRLPFLSHELVEFIFSMPSSIKINDGWTKWIMRKSFNILPEEIRWRKDKIGFEPPQKSWTDAPKFKELVHEGRKKLVANNYLNKKNVFADIKSVEANNTNINTWKHLMASMLIK
jgi:asparagine synthase (glutamine-hydrolysing)